MKNNKIELFDENIFIDTSAWYALINKNDKYYQQISYKYSNLLKNNNNLITNNLIISETFTLLRYRLNLSSPHPFKFINYINNSQRINNVIIPQKIYDVAHTILKQFQDHKFSYTDAVSFAYMKKNNIKYSLTLDNHFKIAGFIII